MTVQQMVEKTRTVRRFQQDKRVDEAFLRQLVDCARVSGSARNSQVLKYMLVTEGMQCDKLFPMLGWAGYLSDWKGPEAGEQPSAYIICLLDEALLKGAETEAHFDLGIATQSMLLCAAEQGVFGCRIGNFSKNIDRVLGIEQPCTVLLVLALGYPAEEIVLEQTDAEGDIRYWRDDNQVHHVPKRPLEEILVTPNF